MHTTNKAVSQWETEVRNSADEARSLMPSIHDLERQMDWLVDTIQDLGNVTFPDEMEDYTILEKARQLWKLLSSDVSKIRANMQSCSNEIYDLRRAVEFYKH